MIAAIIVAIAADRPRTVRSALRGNQRPTALPNSGIGFCVGVSVRDQACEMGARLR